MGSVLHFVRQFRRGAVGRLRERRLMNAVALAEHYFALSNQHNLEEIETLFTASSTYSSDNQGVFLGPDQIMPMMRNFFASYSELNWTIEEVRELRPGVVEIEFRFQGRDAEGQPSDRLGVERIVVYEGRIQHIEVRNR